jgi:hypothetical protein
MAPALIGWSLPHNWLGIVKLQSSNKSYSSCPYGSWTALPNHNLKTVLLCPWPPSHTQDLLSHTWTVLDCLPLNSTLNSTRVSVLQIQPRGEPHSSKPRTRTSYQCSLQGRLASERGNGRKAWKLNKGSRGAGKEKQVIGHYGYL